ncbi:MAG: DNA-binding transcriptional regulator Fis [Gammaproteobacteria bacterium]|nr:DNA-binding transcriptional regulator Fis [Gammaproteobacteria bacterium]
MNVSDVLRVDATRAKEPLRECVRDAVARYFRQLDGHDTSDLFELVMGEVEAPLLEAVLEHTRGNLTRAAAILGINRGTLRKKLKQYKLD